MRLDFEQPADVLLVFATRLLAQLDSPELCGFFDGCARAELDGRGLRDRLAGVLDGLQAAHLDQEAAFGKVRGSRGADEPHVTALDGWMQDAWSLLGMASKAGDAHARELRRRLRLSTYGKYGGGRKALHVADALVMLREVRGIPGLTPSFLARADAAVQALRPVIAEVQKSLEAQKAITARVEKLGDELEVVTVQIRLAHGIAERALGAELPELDFSAITARPKKTVAA